MGALSFYTLTLKRAGIEAAALAITPLVLLIASYRIIRKH